MGELAEAPGWSMSSGSLGLPRERRLTQGRDFLRIKTLGRRLTHGTVIFNWLPMTPPGASRLGIITSRRVGDAVVRSRARRLLRESFRRHQNELSHPVDLVLVARPSIAGKSFHEVETDLLTGLRRAGLLGKAA